MKKLIIFAILALISATSYAGSPEVTTKCNLIEKASGNRVKSKVLDITTLSGENGQSIAIKPHMAIDSEALYLLSLAKGSDHLDATGDIVGSDYYLSLIRQQDESRSVKTKSLKGELSDMALLQVKYDMLFRTAHANKKGNFVTGTPDVLKLDYKLAGGKSIKLECEIISVR